MIPHPPKNGHEDERGSLPWFNPEQAKVQGHFGEVIQRLKSFLRQLPPALPRHYLQAVILACSFLILVSSSALDGDLLELLIQSAQITYFPTTLGSFTRGGRHIRAFYEETACLNDFLPVWQEAMRKNLVLGRSEGVIHAYFPHLIKILTEDSLSPLSVLDPREEGGWRARASRLSRLFRLWFVPARQIHRRLREHGIYVLPEESLGKKRRILASLIGSDELQLPFYDSLFPLEAC